MSRPIERSSEQNAQSKWVGAKPSKTVQRAEAKAKKRIEKENARIRNANIQEIKLAAHRYISSDPDRIKVSHERVPPSPVIAGIVKGLVEQFEKNDNVLRSLRGRVSQQQ